VKEKRGKTMTSILWGTDGKRYLLCGNQKICIGSIRIKKGDVNGNDKKRKNDKKQ
jgi:hypothetical protein